MMRKLNITELHRLSVNQFKESHKLPLIIVLDDIRSMYNVGSIFRTADAFRIEKIILCGITSCPPAQEIHKTALGAENSVTWEYCEDAVEAIHKLKDSGYYVFAVEQVENSLKLNDFITTPNASYAFVMGNEVKGVQQRVVNVCDQSLEIPQFGTKHSLNVANTASIVMWELLRQDIQSIK
jgi:tRNA G18 (ribose-2'-O)-methylase SpoU